MNSEITRELLQTAPVAGMPGWKTRVFLITYPAGADSSGHSHPAPGIGYALKGTMVSENCLERSRSASIWRMESDITLTFVPCTPPISLALLLHAS